MWDQILCKSKHNHSILKIEMMKMLVVINFRNSPRLYYTLTLAKVHFLYWKLGVNRSIKYK